jgi:energy-coupling factor transport system permease protein
MSRASLFLYRPLPSPLHAARAGVGALWVLALTVAVLLLSHPVALGALALAVICAGWGAGVGRVLLRALRNAVIVAVPIVAVNVLVSRNGLTVFARLGDLGPFGRGDLTVEALVYGCVIALKVTLLILLSSLFSLAVDPDALLRLFRRLSFRSALTASLSVRMIPVLAADSVRLAEAMRTRPPGALGAPRGPRGRRALGGLRALRARAALVSAVVVGSLDRAMDVAAVLELRGFAGAPRAAIADRSLRLPFSRHDFAFTLSAVSILALALFSRALSVTPFTEYPLVHMSVGPGLWVLCAALLLAVGLPFCDRRGIEL